MLVIDSFNTLLQAYLEALLTTALLDGCFRFSFDYLPFLKTVIISVIMIVAITSLFMVLFLL
jgi:hypothetical protein